MRWYEVEEHLPEKEKLKFVYSAVFNSYHVAYFSPYKGWCDADHDQLRCVTHWCDYEIPALGGHTKQVNRKLAKKHLIKLREGWDDDEEGTD